MNSIDIYNPTNLSSFVSVDYSVNQLQEYYNNAELLGNKSKVFQCCICAKIQDTLMKKHNGNTNSKGYKKEATQILLATNMKKSQFNKDAAVGRYVITQQDITLFELPKSAIESKFLPPKEIKPKQPKVIQVNTDKALEERVDILESHVEFYKDILRTMRDNMEQSNYDWNRYCTKLGINPDILKL